jgi:hypothetical protein
MDETCGHRPGAGQTPFGGAAQRPAPASSMQKKSDLLVALIFWSNKLISWQTRRQGESNKDRLLEFSKFR